MLVEKSRPFFAVALALALAALASPLSAFAQTGNAAPAPSQKPSLFVGAFESPEQMGGDATGAGLSAMLTDALVQDGRFIVVERYALSDIQGEQQLGTQGSTAATTAAQSGHLIGAKYLVRGTVTKYEPKASGASLNVGGPTNFFTGLGSTAGVSDTTAEVAIAIRLIDTTTGQILYAGEATGSASTKGFDAQLYEKNGYSIGGSAFQSTPLGQAAEDAIDKLVKKLAAVLVQQQ